MREMHMSRVLDASLPMLWHRLVQWTSPPPLAAQASGASPRTCRCVVLQQHAPTMLSVRLHAGLLRPTRNAVSVQLHPISGASTQVTVTAVVRPLLPGLGWPTRRRGRHVLEDLLGALSDADQPFLTSSPPVRPQSWAPRLSSGGGPSTDRALVVR